MGESWEAMPDSYPIYNGENDATFCCDRFFAAKTESYIDSLKKVPSTKLVVGALILISATAFPLLVIA